LIHCLAGEPANRRRYLFGTVKGMIPSVSADDAGI